MVFMIIGIEQGVKSAIEAVIGNDLLTQQHVGNIRDKKCDNPTSLASGTSVYDNPVPSTSGTNIVRRQNSLLLQAGGTHAPVLDTKIGDQTNILGVVGLRESHSLPVRDLSRMNYVSNRPMERQQTTDQISIDSGVNSTQIVDERIEEIRQNTPNLNDNPVVLLQRLEVTTETTVVTENVQTSAKSDSIGNVNDSISESSVIDLDENSDKSDSNSPDKNEKDTSSSDGEDKKPLKTSVSKKRASRGKKTQRRRRRF